MSCEPDFFGNIPAGCEVEAEVEAEVAVDTEADMDMEMDMEMEGDMDMSDYDGDMDHMDHGKMEMEMDDEMKMAMRDANLAFLMMAGSATAWAVIDLFFWKWQITYTGATYNGGTAAGGQEAHFAAEYAMIAAGTFEQGWWRMGSLIKTWGVLVIMGVAFLTQLLSMFGMFAHINMLVWGWGVMLGGGILSMVSGIMTMLSYRQAMKAQADDSDTNSGSTMQTLGTNGMALQEAIEKDMLKMMVHETAATLTAWEYGEMWMKAQFMALTPEEQEMWMEKHGDDKSDWSDKDGDDMHHDDMDESAETDAAEESAESEEEGTIDFGLYRKNVFRF